MCLTISSLVLNNNDLVVTLKFQKSLATLPHKVDPFVSHTNSSTYSRSPIQYMHNCLSDFASSRKFLELPYRVRSYDGLRICLNLRNAVEA
jgi:hypothetical protein